MISGVSRKSAEGEIGAMKHMILHDATEIQSGNRHG